MVPYPDHSRSLIFIHFKLFIIMNIKELEKYANDHFQHWLGEMWDNYDAHIKSKIILGFVQGYTQAEIDEAKRRIDYINPK